METAHHSSNLILSGFTLEGHTAPREDFGRDVAATRLSCGLRLHQVGASTVFTRRGDYVGPGRPLASRMRAASPRAGRRAPGKARRKERCCSDPARAGRKAAGLASASCRRMATGSSMALSASGRRPRSARRLERLFSELARSVRKAAGLASASGHRLLAGAQRLAN
jgi:hypothetical protein